jgi:hypothetical protein
MGSIIAKTQTPPLAIAMVSEGSEELSGDPSQGHGCLPRRVGRLRSAEWGDATPILEPCQLDPRRGIARPSAWSGLIQGQSA